MNPPDHAIVLCVDEKSQIQALDRTAPMLRMRIGSVEKRTHDYVRHGISTLFAALDIATGKVTGLCKPRHRHQEFHVFLKHLARAYPERELHLVMDNYANPYRLRTLCTVKTFRPSRYAIRDGPQRRMTRTLMMRRSGRVGVWFGLRCGRELRSAIPAGPSAR